MFLDLNSYWLNYPYNQDIWALWITRVISLIDQSF